MRAKALCLLLCTLLLGISLHGDPLHGADVGKGGKPGGTSVPAVLEKSKAPSLPAKSTGIKLLPPDLEVSEIGLDGKCRVVLGVRNKGNGPVTDEAFRRGQIRVEVVAERRKEVIPFTKADPTGALKAPGGAVKVVSGLVLERKTKDDRPQLVEAEVDSTRQIVESEEDNNLDKKGLQPSCRAAEVKGIEGLGGAKGFEKKDGDAGRMGVKRLASGGISVPGGKRNRDEDGCPLVVEELVASGSEVVVILGRKGAARIEPAEAAKIRLLVLAGTQHPEWSLKEIEKGLQQHKGSGEQWEFATGLKLEKPVPVMARLLGCEGRALTRMLSPSGGGKLPPPPSVAPKPGPGGGSEEQAVALGESRMSAESVRPGGATPTVPAPESRMEGGASSLLSPDFPSRITRVSEPVYAGVIFSISGVDFGRRQGQVRWVANPPLFDGMGSLEIISWSDTLIEVKIAESWARSIREAREAALHVWPAQVEEDDRPRTSTEPPARYPYSGSEGPMIAFQIQPRSPVVNSPDEAAEGEELEIRGQHFGDEAGSSGGVRFSDDSIPFSVVSWSNRLIRLRIPNGEIPTFGSGDTRTVTTDVTVTNDLGLSDAARLTIRRVDAFDLAVAGVMVTNFRTEWGNPRSNVAVVIRNNGPDRYFGSVNIRFRNSEGDTHDTTVSAVADGLATGAEATAQVRETDYHHDNKHLWIEILSLSDSNAANNSCEVNVSDGWENARHNCL